MGGVGWGMLTSCSWYVDGWGGVGHVNVMFMVRGNFEKEHVAACWSRVLTLKQQREKKSDYQHIPFHANIKNIANTKKKNSPSYYTTSGSKNSTFPLKKKQRLSWNVLFRVGKQENQKLWKWTCCSRLMKLKQQRAKKGWLSTCAVSCQR